jgi:hypothetical protein
MYTNYNNNNNNKLIENLKQKIQAKAQRISGVHHWLKRRSTRQGRKKTCDKR